MLPGTVLVALALLLALPMLLGLYGRHTQLCALLFVAGAAANATASSSHADFVCSRDFCEAPPLPDRGFEALGDHSDNEDLVRVVDALPPMLLCALIATLYRCGERERTTVLSGLSLVLFARAVVVQSTGLPPAKQGNASLPLHETEVARLLRDLGGGDPPDGHSHYDLMFSGHASMFFGCLLWLLQLHGKLDGAAAPAWFVAAFSAAVAESAGLVAVRIHYTADVLIGMVISGLAFANGRTTLAQTCC
jgi:hypothetical protein